MCGSRATDRRRSGRRSLLRPPAADRDREWCTDRCRRLALRLRDWPISRPIAVDDDALESVLAAKHRVVLPLQTGLSDLIARLEVHKLRRRQFVFGYFTDIAERVRGKFALGITPPRLEFDTDFRQFVTDAPSQTRCRQPKRLLSERSDETSARVLRRSTRSSKFLHRHTDARTQACQPFVRRCADCFHESERCCRKADCRQEGDDRDRRFCRAAQSAELHERDSASARCA